MGFAEDFVGKLQALPQFPDTFNPYTDTCQKYDRDDAPKIRSQMLTAIIEKAMRSEVEALWVGLAPGHLGARRTGLGLTDDANRAAYLERWRVEADCPTRSAAPQRETTAKRVWSELSRIDEPIFLWNVFPLHPHCADDPFSNRPKLTPEEHNAGKQLLKKLVDELKPRRIIAIGVVAREALQEFANRSEVRWVYHPSRRMTKFSSGIRKLYPLGEGFA